MSQKRGFTGAQRVSGPDFMEKVFEISQQKKYRHFFYGSTNKTLKMLKENIEKKYSYLNIVGMLL